MSIVFEEWKKAIENPNLPSQNLIPSATVEPVVEEQKFKAKDHIRKIDDLLPEELYNRLFENMNRQTFIGGWASSKQTDPHGHWNSNFVQYDYSVNLADKYDLMTNSVAKEVWDWIKENVPEFKDKILLRCYMNAHTYGVDGYFHTDSRRENEKTIVVYLLEGEWDKNWAGETAFANKENEIIQSVLPKRNRGVVFNGNIQHCARGVSRVYMGLRRTFMIKARDRRSDNFEKLSNFLIKHKAYTKGHKNGSLHDHLVRTFQLLENKGAPEHVCFGAGLHSVFGTNIYKDGLFTLNDRDVIISEFGEKAFELAALFNLVNRPSTLENPESYENGKYHLKMNNGNVVALEPEVLNELRLIEGANLRDQRSLNQEKYPNIHEYYTKYGQNV